jgi:hypothetical protein
VALAVLLAPPVHADTPLEEGFAVALRGCEEWVLRPASWAADPGAFASAAGLGGKMSPVADVDPVSLPPEPLRVANRYWRINATPEAGFVLVVSDRLPMCHITGGGDRDLQPAIEAVLSGSAFARRWEKISHAARGEMATTVFRDREEPAFSMVVSRANTAGQRRDRVQVIATAVYDLPR